MPNLYWYQFKSMPTCIEGFNKTSNNEEEPSTYQKCADLCKFCTGPNIEDCYECKEVDL